MNTIERIEHKQMKRRRQAKDLALVIKLLEGASRFAQSANLDQWVIDRINQLVSDLK